MKKYILAMALTLGALSNAYAQFCPSCIQNSAIPQTAQMNITSATIRNQLTVLGSLVGPNSFTSASSMTASVFVGSGTYLTNLNASQLLYGIVPTDVLVGGYTGITSVGVLGAGVWNASIISSQYGGTGANLVTSGTGSIPYFGSTGVMASLPPGTAAYLLQTNGSSAPSWTGTPQILGTNVTSIPMVNLIPGQLPSNISINDASISTVSAAKVIGNIPGKATNITGNLPLTQLSTGTLVNTIVASSITVTGVIPGIYGGPQQLIQETVGTDGRLTAISQSTFTVYAASITAGALPSGVTIGASQITPGSLGGSVIASSLNVTGVTPGSYGFASQTSSITVLRDGRISFAQDVPIAINTSQINNGTLTAGVLVPAANIQAGSLASNVLASSVAATGIVAGTYGTPTNTLQLIVGVDGRISHINQYPITGGGSTSTVSINIDNGWQATQTFFSSITVHGNLSASAVSATSFAGDGSALSNLTPSQISGGTLGPSVIASSIGVNGVTAGTYGNSTNVGQFTVGPDGRITSASNVGIPGISTHTALNNQDNAWTAPQTFFSSITALNISGYGLNLLYGINASTAVFSGAVTTVSSVNASAFFGDGSHVTNISMPCVYGTGANSVNCQGVSNSATAPTSVVSGGSNNTASATNAFVGGGSANTAAGNNSFVGGGFNNTASNLNSVVAGGNANGANANDASIGGGQGNTVSAIYGTVAGGQGNTAYAGAAIGGGAGNGAGGTEATVGGGLGNNASGDYSTIPGGFTNATSGNKSFAAGSNAHANDLGSIVFADSNSGNYNSHGQDTFNVRATTGVFIDTIGGVYIATASLNVLYSSVTASAFFGDGSHLTGVSSAFPNTISSSFTVTGAGGILTTSSVTASALFAGSAKIGNNVNLTTAGVGVGVTNPNYPIDIYATGASTVPSVHVVGDGIASGLNIEDYFTSNPAGSFGAKIQSKVGRGTYASPTAIQSGDILYQMPIFGYTGTSFSTGTVGNISFAATENWGPNNNGGRWTMNSVQGGTITTKDTFIFTSSMIYTNVQMFKPATNFGPGGSAYIMEDVLGNWEIQDSSPTAVFKIIGNGLNFPQTVGYANPANNHGVFSVSFAAPVDSLAIAANGNVSAASNISATSSMTASAFFGDGSHLTGITTVIPNTVSSSWTVTGVGGILAQGSSVTASAFFGDAGQLTYGGSQTNAIPFITTAGSTLTFDANFLSWDDVNHRLGIRTANPIHGIDCSSCTLYLDGNSPNPILVGNNGSSLTFTTNGDLKIAGALVSSSITGPVLIVSTISTSGNPPLHISSGAYAYDYYGSSTAITSNTGVMPQYRGRVYSGTITSPTAIPDATPLSGLAATGFDGAGYPTGGATPGELRFTSSGTYTSSSHGTTFALFVTSITSVSRVQAVTVTDQGNMGIGTTVPTSTLTVNGTANVISSMTAGVFVGSGNLLTSVKNSSCTVIPNSTFTNTTFGVAFATVTLTTRGFPVYMSVAATLQGSNAADNLKCTALVDSGFNTNVGSAALSAARVAAANTDANMAIGSAQLLQSSNASFTAGSHTFALACDISANTGTIVNDSSHYAQLCVSEDP